MKTIWIVQNIFYGLRDIVVALFKRRQKALLFMLPFLLVVALLLAMVSSSGALAPFLYPLF